MTRRMRIARHVAQQFHGWARCHAPRKRFIGAQGYCVRTVAAHRDRDYKQQHQGHNGVTNHCRVTCEVVERMATASFSAQPISFGAGWGLASVRKYNLLELI